MTPSLLLCLITPANNSITRSNSVIGIDQLAVSSAPTYPFGSVPSRSIFTNTVSAFGNGTEIVARQ